ncbi:MAG: YndM family protein [Clostridia bacterium]|nr:YndM family protein [Clostridia bacterium]
MRHVFALVFKLLVVGIIVGIVLAPRTNIWFSDYAFIVLTVTFVSYLLGDLVILPRTNNTIATIADIGLSLVTIYMFNFIIPGTRIYFWDALLTSVVLAVGEWVFHKLVATTIVPTNK